MEIEIGKTAKYLRDKQGVPDSAKEQLKEFNRIKKAIVDALKEQEMTIPQTGRKIANVQTRRYLLSSNASEIWYGSCWRNRRYG